MKAVLLMVCLLFHTSFFANNNTTFFDDKKNKFVVLIPSYNNAQWAEKNLSSLLEQRYENWVGIYLDDGSSDSTKTVVEEYLAKHDLEKRIFYHRNEINRGNCANLWYTIHHHNKLPFEIDDKDVIVIYDGDDWYHSDQALSMLHNIYKYSDIWATYGGFIAYPDTVLKNDDFSLYIPDFVEKNNEYRRFWAHSSQQRSFYAGLYRAIKLEDFFYNSAFLTAGQDVAYMLPILEMSAPRYRCLVHNDFYIYNRATPLNDDKVKAKQQKAADIYVRRKKIYKRLESLENLETKKTSAELDMILILENHEIDDILSYLEKLEQKTKNIRCFYLLLPKELGGSYRELSNKLPRVTIIVGSLQSTLAMALDKINSDYVLITKNFRYPCRTIDLDEIVNLLRITKTPHMQLAPQEIVQGQAIVEDITAWQTTDQRTSLKSFLSLDIYSKNVLKSVLKKQLQFHTPGELENIMENHKIFRKPDVLHLRLEG